MVPKLTLHKVKIKTGPILLRNILGPVSYFDLDQFLTLESVVFMIYFCVFFAEATIFIVFSAKHAKFKRHTKNYL